MGTCSQPLSLRGGDMGICSKPLFRSTKYIISISLFVWINYLLFATAFSLVTSDLKLLQES